jgi:hypothetical protein
MAGKGIYDVDAMARTVWRMPISHKRLLEWSPSDDPGRYRETVYEIDVLQQFAGKSETSVTIDGIPQPDGAISLVDDHRNRSVEVVIRTDRSDSQARDVD